MIPVPAFKPAPGGREAGERTIMFLAADAGDSPPAERAAGPRPTEAPAVSGGPAAKTGPFQDVPRWIWRIFLGGWAGFFGLLLTFFTTSRSATFMVVISALFAVVAFGLVFALAGQGRVDGAASPDVVHTHTGDLSPMAAAAQVALIPVAVCVGLAAFILLAL